MKKIFVALLLLILTGCVCEGTRADYDVLVVGGSASGISAAVQSARMGSQTLLVEEHPWLGGMLTSAGVSAVDGNYNLRGGIWGEFLDSLAARYGSLDALKTGWVSNVLFEPSVGNAVFQNMAAYEPGLKVRHGVTVQSLSREDEIWKAVLIDGEGEKNTVYAKTVIDATELGDIARMTGVSYDIGMESSSLTGEDIAPPYANEVIQDLTYVMILKDYGRDMTIEMPAGYDPSFFTNTAVWEGNTVPAAGQTIWPVETMLEYGKLPNGKYMINWPIDGNDYYLNIIELDPAGREQVLEKAKNFSLCYLYFMQTSLGLETYGLADDEFPTNDLFPFIPYHRESRRIHGKVRFTVDDASKPYHRPLPLYRTAVAVGDYPVDHHHHRYPGFDTLPELHFYPIPSYGLPLGVMIPEGKEGLIVAEKSVSVSNIVNGTTRLQPVVLGIGQAAGALASLAASRGIPPSQVSVRDVQKALLDAKAYLLPYLDVDVDDPLFPVLQRIGATGILKGEGKNIGWSNQTWFNASSPVISEELRQGLSEFYGIEFEFDNEYIMEADVSKILAAFDIDAGPGATDKAITRGQLAIILDSELDPFSNFDIDIHGNIIRKDNELKN